MKILYGDGSNDDTAAIQALFSGESVLDVRTMKIIDAIPQELVYARAVQARENLIEEADTARLGGDCGEPGAYALERKLKEAVAAIDALLAARGVEAHEIVVAERLRIAKELQKWLDDPDLSAALAGSGLCETLQDDIRAALKVSD